MIPWHNLLRARETAEAIVSPEPRVAPNPPAEWVRRGDDRLDESAVDRLALALHDRYHGEHTPERGKAECARLSGAYDDVYVLEPLILDLIRAAS